MPEKRHPSKTSRTAPAARSRGTTPSPHSDLGTAADRLYQRAEDLLQRSSASPAETGKLLPDAFQELSCALQELQVAQAELRQQDEQLAVARAAVESERQRYQDLFEFAPDGYLVTDVSGVIREANRAASELLNVTQSLLIGKPLSTFVAREDRDTFNAQIAVLRPGENVQDWRIHIRRRKGPVFPAAITAAPFADSEGNLAGLRWSLRDITRRVQAERALQAAHDHLEQRVADRTTDLVAASERLKDEISQRERTQEALRQSDERCRSLFENMTEGFFLAEVICDESGRPVDYRYLDANPALEPLTGLRRDEIIGKTAREVLPGIEDYWIETYGRVALTGEPAGIEQFAQPLGRYYDTVAYSPLRGQVAVIFSDVTDRKQIEQALREAKGHLEIRIEERTAELECSNRALQEEVAERKRAEEAVKAERQRFNDALETLPAYLVLLTPDHHVAFANRFFRERFGEAHGRRCYEYLFGRSEPCEVCETYRPFKTMAPHRWEWTGPDRRNYDVFDFPFTDTDGSTLIMEVGIDITERKRAEEALKEANETLEQRVAERTAALAASQQRLQHANELLEAVTTGTGVLIAAQDTNLRYTFFNDTYRQEVKRLSGSDIETGTSMVEVFAHLPEQQRIAVERWSRTLRGQSSSYMIEFGDPGGYQRVYSVLHAPLRDAEGNVVGAGEVAYDVTEQVRAQQALRESEERERARSEELAKVLDAVPAAVWIGHDPQGRVITGNAYAHELVLKIPRGGSISLRASPDDTAVSYRVFRDGVELMPEELPAQLAAASGQSVFDQELELRFPDGRTVHLIAGAAPLFDAAGRVRGSVTAGADVTRIKQAEQELFETRQRLQWLLEAVPVGISFSDDPTCQRITGNPTCLAQFEVGPEDNLSASAPDRSAPGRQVRFFAEGREISDAELPLQRAVARNRDVPPMELEVLLPSGRHWIAEASGAPIRDVRGNVIGGVAVTVDITERRRLEQVEKARIEEARLLDTIVENTEVHLAYLDREFNLLRVNSTYAKTWGYAPEQMVGLNHFDLYPYQDDESIFRYVRDTGELFHVHEKPFEFPNQSGRGATYWDWTLAPVKDQHGAVQGLVLSLMDVTAQVRAREQLLSAERARTQIAETLVDEISHRMKNNLAIAAGLLQMQVAGEPEDSRAAAIINDAVARLQAFAVVHELMYSTQQEEIELQGALRGVAEIGSELYRDRQADIWVGGDSVLCPSKTATNICIAANELITNAIKYGGPGPGGRLAVRVRIAREDDKFSLSVWNSGNPVPPDFDPARQTGMGLQVVRTVAVDQYRGTFTMRPHDGGTLAEIVVEDEALRD